MVKVGPDICLPTEDAQILEQIQSGKEFPHSANNLVDLTQLAFHLGAEEFCKARELAEKIAARSAPVLLTSSSMVDNSNQNHLMSNPFSR